MSTHTGRYPQRLAAPRIAELVADELRRRIIDGELTDGDLLPRQDVLVKQFRVSLVSLREALRILETEGLISVRRGNRGGAIVHSPTQESAAYMVGLVLQNEFVDVSDLGTALLELEPTCAALGAQREDRQDTLVPQLHELNDVMAAHLADGSRFTEVGRQFHDAIVRGCGNHTMITVIGSLESLWTRHERSWAAHSNSTGAYPTVARRRTALNAHKRITDLIADGAADRARRIAATHLAETQTYVLAEGQTHRIVVTSQSSFTR